MHSSIRSQIIESIKIKEAMLNEAALLENIQTAVKQCISAIRAGNKIFFCGNGGSAADAQHLAGELVSRFAYDRDALPGLALTTDTSVLTAIGNDYGFEHSFSRQIKGLGRPKDVLIALSTSGNSQNILAACVAARALGIFCIGMTGQSGGKLLHHVDICLNVPSNLTPRIQEAHICIGHILCGEIEAGMFPRDQAQLAQ